MGDNTLNEKLLVFAGFEFVRNATPSGGVYYDRIVQPDGKHIHVSELPDFPSSVDACFAHLVPICHKRLGSITILSTYDVDNSNWFYHAFIGAKGKGTAETPSLALCEAIEYLLDREGSHE